MGCKVNLIGAELDSLRFLNLPHGEPVEPRTTALPRLIRKKSHQLIQHVPTQVILNVSFPAEMLPETFESRERIGASASRGGKPVRPGRFRLSASIPREGTGRTRQKPQNRRSGWSLDRKHSIPHTPRPAFQGPPVFPSFNSQTQLRAWQRERPVMSNATGQHRWIIAVRQPSDGGGSGHFGFLTCIKAWKDCHTNAIMRKYAPSGTNQSK